MSRDTPRGFATMDQEKQREIARKGGANVPKDKRSFARDRALASEAGRKGGRSVASHTRSFSQNRALAAEAGRKGGLASQRRRSHTGSRLAEPDAARQCRHGQCGAQELSLPPLPVPQLQRRDGIREHRAVIYGAPCP